MGGWKHNIINTESILTNTWRAKFTKHRGKFTNVTFSTSNTVPRLGKHLPFVALAYCKYLLNNSHFGSDQFPTPSHPVSPHRSHGDFFLLQEQQSTRHGYYCDTFPHWWLVKWINFGGPILLENFRNKFVPDDWVTGLEISSAPALEHPPEVRSEQSVIWISPWCLFCFCGANLGSNIFDCCTLAILWYISELAVLTNSLSWSKLFPFRRLFSIFTSFTDCQSTNNLDEAI